MQLLTASRRGLFVDVSGYNAINDWQKYKAWSEGGDGVSRLCMKVTEGVGYTDTKFAQHKSASLNIGIVQNIYYHFGRPDLSNGAVREAMYFADVLNGVRPSDVLMLDAEASPGNAEWTYQWCVQTKKNFPNNPVIIYSYKSYIQSFLQDSRLAQFPLYYAYWQYDPNALPPCPSPWTSYCMLQYSDKEMNVPGVNGPVDADVYIGGLTHVTSGVPAGWSDDPVNKILTAKNGRKLRTGFRDLVLGYVSPGPGWDADDCPLEEEAARNPVEVSNPSLGGGTRQVFTQRVLEWTPQRGCFVAWGGQELLKVEQLLATEQKAHQEAQAQVETLNKQLTAMQKAAEELTVQLTDVTAKYNEAQAALQAAQDREYAKAMQSLTKTFQTEVERLPPYP